MSDLTCLMPERGSCIYLFGWEQNNDAKDCSTEQDPLLSLRKALSLFCTSTCQWENTNRCCPSQRWTKATMKDKSKTERQHLSPSHRGEEGGGKQRMRPLAYYVPLGYATSDGMWCAGMKWLHEPPIKISKVRKSASQRGVLVHFCMLVCFK